MNFWHPFFASFVPLTSVTFRLLLLLGFLGCRAVAVPVEFRFVPPDVEVFTRALPSVRSFCLLLPRLLETLLPSLCVFGLHPDLGQGCPR